MSQPLRAAVHRCGPLRIGSLLLAGLFALPVVLVGQSPTPTTVVVRAIAQDAKIVGSGVGGARITIRDTRTGAVLATGLQEGGTGDTQAIMGDRPREGGVFDTEGAGHFEATIDLTEPTHVLIEAVGPLGTPHASQSATASLLLVPGRHLTGDGVVLTLHGFTVELLETPVELASGSRLDLRARITMLCGCPTEPGGLWDSSGYDLAVDLLHEGAAVASGTLSWAGETSLYDGALDVPDDATPGEYVLRVVAVDPSTTNAGMLQQRVVVR